MLSLLDWLSERRDNCLRIMETKQGDERLGWVEDAAYFEAATVRLSERYFIAGDNSGHAYYVPVSRRNEFYAWAELPDDDERGWEEPDYAVRIDGMFTFIDPRCE